MWLAVVLAQSVSSSEGRCGVHPTNHSQPFGVPLLKAKSHVSLFCLVIPDNRFLENIVTPNTP